MRILAVLASLLISAKAFSTLAPSEANWSVVKNSPLLSLSADFEFKKGDAVEARAVRTGLFCPHYHYDLYNLRDEFEARGITRFFSLGTLFSWGMEIDVYSNDTLIGKIEGQMLTKTRAKFAFYDGYGNVTANAFLNKEKPEFVIASAQNESNIFARLKGRDFGDLSLWEIDFTQSADFIDERILKIFATFVADYNSDFLPPPKVINHYFYYPPQDRR